VRRKILTGKYGYEYIKPIYYVYGGTITPSMYDYNCGSFDVLHIDAIDMIKK